MSDTKKPIKAKRRRRGERKDGLVAVYADLGRKPDGSRDRRTFYGHTHEEAELKRLSFMDRRSIGAPSDSDTITVAQWCDRWLTTYNPTLTGTNAVTYEICINRLKDDMGFARVRDIRHVHLQSSLNKMNGMSRSAQTKYRMVVKQIFKRARQNKIIPDDPSEDLTLPNGSSGEHRALDRWESDLIIANWYKTTAGFWAMLMMLSGLRRGEMIALDWSDIDLQARTISVTKSAEIVRSKVSIKNHTKTDAGMRTLPICEILYNVLTTVPPADRHGPVCVSSHGKQISQGTFAGSWKTFNSVIERIANNEPIDQRGKRYDLINNRLTYPLETAPTIKDPPERVIFSIRAHDLRYTFATALYDAGVDVKSAQYYLGHSDIRVTMNLYTRFSRERENLARTKTTGFLDSWVKNEPPKMDSHPIS